MSTFRSFHEPQCSAGVPPASSPSVSLDEGPGGVTPPELAAVDGCATPRRFIAPDARPILEVEALREPKGRASSPLRADGCNNAFLQGKERRARSDAPYLGQPVHRPDSRLVLEVEGPYDHHN